MMKPVHALWIPSWYCLEEDPIKGIFFKEQAQALRQAGINIGVIYPEIRPLRHLTLSLGLKNHFQTSFKDEAGIPTVRMHGWNLFPCWGKRQMQAWVAAAMRLMECYVARRGLPTVIHAHSVLWGGICAEAIAQKYQIPYIITEHFTGMQQLAPLGEDLKTCWSRPYLRMAYQNAHQVFAVGSALKQAIESLTDREVVVMPNFFDEVFFQLKPASSTKEPFRYLCLAQLSDTKNYPLLLRAFQKAYKQNPQLVLEIGGSGKIRGQLEKLSASLGIASAVHFLGGLSRGEVAAAMQRAHAFVLASRIETFGVVLIEALATGLPVIATCCGGPEDIVHQANGMLVPSNDEDALAQAILEMPKQYDHYDPKLLRADVIERFGKKTITEKIIHTYQSLQANP